VSERFELSIRIATQLSSLAAMCRIKVKDLSCVLGLKLVTIVPRIVL